MEQLDSRRLTGPNLLWDRPGAVMDVLCTPAEAERLVSVWEHQARRMLEAVGWGNEEVRSRRLSGGVTLAISAPIDALYSATEVNDWAWTASQAMLGGGDEPTIDEDAARLEAVIAEERNPALMALQAAAADHNVVFLSDDDHVSVGLGKHSRTWAVDALPHPDEVDWSEIGRIPVAMVTGTNGKTTVVRLAARMARAAGLSVGLSSTTWIAVGDEVLDQGDYAGPGGARAILRERRVDLAILETARGGMLRRGLGVNHADAAAITTIAQDHLGDYGSHTLRELLEAKWVITRALNSKGRLILNADDPLLVERSTASPAPIIWCSLDSGRDLLKAHVANGGTAATVRNGVLGFVIASEWQPLCHAEEVPLAMGGVAEHNIANALTAAAVVHILGVPNEAIVKALTTMQPEDNPGRCNLFEIDGVTIIVDFAHNPQAYAALLGFAQRIPAKRRLISLGQAGDRPDDLIRELARSAWKIGLDRVHVCELAHYHRGRAEGEIYTILRDEFQRLGAEPDQVQHFDTELESLEAALEWAQPGDQLVMFALGEGPQVTERLESLRSTRR